MSPSFQTNHTSAQVEAAIIYTYKISVLPPSHKDGLVFYFGMSYKDCLFCPSFSLTLKNLRISIIIPSKVKIGKLSTMQ